MRALGYEEGKNLVIEWRFADEHYERLETLAAELVARNVAVIVTQATPSTLAAQKATTSIPIVFWGVTDPVERGFVASLAKPGGNITGGANFTMTMASKQLELLREIIPTISRVGLLSSRPIQDARDSEQVMLSDWAKSGIQTTVGVAGKYEDIAVALETIAKGRTEALILAPFAPFYTHRQMIVDRAMKNRLPIASGNRSVTQAGGLFSYGDQGHENILTAATYVDSILKGAKPGNLPIRLSTTFELVVNLKSARALGLTIPPALLLRADQVIQ